MMIYLGAGAALVGYLIIAWIVGSLLHLDSSRFNTLFAILTVLGISATAAFLWFWKKSHANASAEGSQGTGPMGKDDEIDALVREAENRLAASNLAKGAKLNNLPLVFVIGDAGSTKTSTILHSGLDPELLAGSVYQDTTVVPTRLANIWFARGMIFVEAGGKLLAEPQRWKHLLQRLRPARLLSAMRGEQAPRAAIVCLDAETFVRAGAADALTMASRNLQKRLSELSEEFGISFPVYVLFTKMNRLAFFEDFVRDLTADEAGHVLGATVPLPAREGGVYAEEEGKRLSAAFDAIFYSLADHRVLFLPRENDLQKVPNAYEFPREFRKLRNGLVQFLVDVCRPSQLRASPFLRGFYFSGVRPILVQDAPVATPRPSAAQRSPFEAAGSATGFFQTGAAPAAPAPIAAAAGGTRKVPQWLFLSHLFADVILRDKAALSASGSSTKASTLQRILLASAAALFLIFAVGFTVSFFGNRTLENEVMEAARGIPPGEAGGMNLPTQDALQKLETLRASLVKLTAYEEDGAPFRLRWFLYAGTDLYPAVRQLYYTRFNQLLFLQTQGKMLASLRMLAIPPASTDDYATTYDTLKAYLITTSEYKRSTKWLSPVLINRWAAGRQVDSILPLATRQFDFFAEDLVRGNPFGDKNDFAAIDRARLHLSKFSGIEQIYQFMISDASRRAKSINFNEQYPGSADVVVNNVEIPGAFTRAGWAVMQDNMARADKFFGGERWVLGDYASAKPEAAKVEEELRNRYVLDYIGKWRDFMNNTKVVRFAGLKDAVKKLNTLSGAQTPLMALFWVATQNTAVSSQKLTDIFDSVQKVVPPPATTVQYVWPTNQEYMGSLASLQTAVSQVAETAATPGPPDPNRGLPVRQSADNARNVLKKLEYTFKIDPESHMETVTSKLLEAPIDYADALTKGMGAGEINNKAAVFCRSFATITNKFPFNPSATAEVTLQELNGMFRPHEGKLWTFYNETLQPLMTKQGPRYEANSTSGIKLTKTFLDFFNAAARFSEAVYPNGAKDPSFHYSLAAQRADQIREMTVTIDGQTTRGTGSKEHTWTASPSQDVQISAKLSGGSDFEFQNRQGMWALFRFFADADRSTQIGNANSLEWIVRQGREGRPVSVGGKELTYRFIVDTGGAEAIYQKNFLISMRCVSSAAQ
ncbi:MAG TPA: ImcF-related family protein [Acidobacteriota bacterium]|nr:ImcF-related family protein [Acidobacteriota bacterium]